jgi:allantoinase
MTKRPEERISYSAIVDRPPLEFDGSTKLVVWPIVNLEVWEIQRAMARQVLPAPTGVSVHPGHSQLVLARVRNARRLLALQGAV